MLLLLLLLLLSCAAGTCRGRARDSALYLPSVESAETIEVGLGVGVAVEHGAVWYSVETVEYGSGKYTPSACVRTPS